MRYKISSPYINMNPVSHSQRGNSYTYTIKRHYMRGDSLLQYVKNVYVVACFCVCFITNKINSETPLQILHIHANAADFFRSLRNVDPFTGLPGQLLHSPEFPNFQMKTFQYSFVENTQYCIQSVVIAFIKCIYSDLCLLHSYPTNRQSQILNMVSKVISARLYIDYTPDFHQEIT